MREEISAAVVFLTRLVKYQQRLSNEQVEEFSDVLTDILTEKFRDHWYENEPSKGQAYRCIRLTDSEPVDPVLVAAAHKIGLDFRDLNLPPELTLWVDPAEVTYRFGELRGCFCTVASFKNGAQQNNAHSLDINQVLSQHHHTRQAHFSKLRLLMNRRTNSLSSGSDSDESSSNSPPPTHSHNNYQYQSYNNIFASRPDASWTRKPGHHQHHQYRKQQSWRPQPNKQVRHNWKRDPSQLAH